MYAPTPQLVSDMSPFQQVPAGGFHLVEQVPLGIGVTSTGASAGYTPNNEHFILQFMVNGLYGHTNTNINPNAASPFAGLSSAPNFNYPTVPTLHLPRDDGQYSPPMQHAPVPEDPFSLSPTTPLHPHQPSTPTTPSVDDMSDVDFPDAHPYSPSSSTRTAFICPVCNGTFPKRSRLDTHFLSHTGERPHSCHFRGCDSRFATRSNLNRHLSNRHGVVLERRGSRAQRNRGLLDLPPVDPLMLLREPAAADLSLIF